MSRTELPVDRQDRQDPRASDWTGRPGVTRRTAAARRRRRRLPRTGVLALVVLLLGTVAARRLEDPGDVTAATVRLGDSHPGASAPLVSPPPTTSSPTPSTPSAAAARATAASAPAVTSTTPHADDDSDGSSSPAPSAGRITVPVAGAGTLTAVAIPAGDTTTSGRAVRYSVEVEDGLPVPAAEVASTVHTVLTDPRGWQKEEGVHFVPVSPAELAAGARVDVRVTLASPTLTARLCAPLNVTAQQVSCGNGSRAALNLTRWMLGSTTYGTDVAQYRIYVISHEVGHGLGHPHVHCPGPGNPAPVMVQQTKSLEACVASPWPTGS